MHIPPDRQSLEELTTFCERILNFSAALENWQRIWMTQVTYEAAIKLNKKELAEQARKEAEKILATVKQETQASPLQRYELAFLYRKAGRTDIALDFYQELTTQDIGNELKGKCCFHLGNLYLRQGDREKAKEFLVECIRVYPEHRRAKYLLYVELGEKNFSFSGLQDIAQVFKEEIKRQLDNQDLLQAARLAEKMHLLLPNHLFALKTWSLALNGLGQNKKAKEIELTMEKLNVLDQNYCECT